MATFGSTPPRDPLNEIKLAISDLQLLHDDTLATLEAAAKPNTEAYIEGAHVGVDWAMDHSKELVIYRAERREPISQARRDDEALPQTPYGDYP